jgi:hypothetical protein
MFRSLRKSIRNRWKQYQKARQAARKAAAKLRAAEAKAAQRRAELKAQIAAAAPLRLVVGASGISEPGWVATDIDDLNLLAETDWRRLFAPASIEAILAEHVWEHLSESDGLIAAQHCHLNFAPRYIVLNQHLVTLERPVVDREKRPVSWHNNAHADA